VLVRKYIDPGELVFAFSREDQPALSATEQRQSDCLKGWPRHEGWIRGRSALKKLLSALKMDLDTSTLTFPHPTISLSHTKDWAVAIGVLAGPMKIDGIGIDLELSRPVQDEHARFYLSKSERESAIDDKQRLRLWTVKEALFKADPDNHDAVVGHYRVQTPSALSGQARNRKGRIFFYACEKSPIDKFFSEKQGGWMSWAVSFPMSASTLKNGGFHAYQ